MIIKIGKIYRFFWVLQSRLRRRVYCHLFGMHISSGVLISPKARLDKSCGKRIHIGSNTKILAGATVLGHDGCRKLYIDTYIGDDCIIGINSIVMPGVHIGNSVVVGAGSIVTKDLPDNCLAVGAPAKVIRERVIVQGGVIVENGTKIINRF